jgi:uncharacterized protein
LAAGTQGGREEDADDVKQEQRRRQMMIEESFEVGAPPERVFDYLLDVEQVIGCMPGAELMERIDDDTFKARVKIKVGPIVTKYVGTARVTERDLEARKATLQADAKESTGAGSAQAAITMSVTEQEGKSHVTLSTDYKVAGRVAQFGRGVMEDVAHRLIGQMATCIQSRLEAPANGNGSAAEGAAAPPPSQPDHVGGLGLFFGVLWDRIKRLFGGDRKKN